ncbi:MAG: hypothetical protein ACRDSJ_23115 [Rubrobacteraceae bacterium]
MDFEVIAWTAFFFGGDILILALLLAKAVRADREKSRGEEMEE